MPQKGHLKPTSKLAVLVAASLLFSGCAVNSERPAIDAKPDLNSMKYLEDLADEARTELRILAQMKQATATKAMTDEQHRQFAINALTVPPGFEEKVDFEITDHAEVVAEAVAAMAGYEFKVVGDSDGHEDIVSIRLRKEPLNKALKEIGAQTGDFIDVQLVPGVMIFEYKSRRQLSDMPSDWSI